MIKDIKVVKEFTNDGRTYGVYDVLLNDTRYILIRNHDSVGAVQFHYGEPASKCIDIIRDDVKIEFFSKLHQEVNQ